MHAALLLLVVTAGSAISLVWLIIRWISSTETSHSTDTSSPRLFEHLGPFLSSDGSGNYEEETEPEHSPVLFVHCTPKEVKPSRSVPLRSRSCSFSKPTGLSKFTIAEDAQYDCPEASAASLDSVNTVLAQAAPLRRYASAAPRQRIHMKVPYGEPDDMPDNFLTHLNQAMMARLEGQAAPLAAYARPGCIQLTVDLASSQPLLDEGSALADSVVACCLSALGMQPPPGGQVLVCLPDCDQPPHVASWNAAARAWDLARTPHTPAGSLFVGAAGPPLDFAAVLVVPLTISCVLPLVVEPAALLRLHVSGQGLAAPGATFHVRCRGAFLAFDVVESSDDLVLLDVRGAPAGSLLVVEAQQGAVLSNWRPVLVAPHPHPALTGLAAELMAHVDDPHRGGLPPPRRGAQEDVPSPPPHLAPPSGPLYSWGPISRHSSTCSSDSAASGYSADLAAAAGGGGVEQDGPVGPLANGTHDHLLCDLGLWLEHTTAAVSVAAAEGVGSAPSAALASVGEHCVSGRGMVACRSFGNLTGVLGGASAESACSGGRSVCCGGGSSSSSGSSSAGSFTSSVTGSSLSRSPSLMSTIGEGCCSMLLAHPGSSFTGCASPPAPPASLDRLVQRTGLSLLLYALRSGLGCTASTLVDGLVAAGQPFHLLAADVCGDEHLSMLHRAVCSGSSKMVSSVVLCSMRYGCVAAWGDAGGARDGVTPLHVAAGLVDGGRLATFILEEYPETRALWLTVLDARGVRPVDLSRLQRHAAVLDACARHRPAAYSHALERQRSLPAAAPLLFSTAAHVRTLEEEEEEEEEGEGGQQQEEEEEEEEDDGRSEDASCDITAGGGQSPRHSGKEEVVADRALCPSGGPGTGGPVWLAPLRHRSHAAGQPEASGILRALAAQPRLPFLVVRRADAWPAVWSMPAAVWRALLQHLMRGVRRCLDAVRQVQACLPGAHD